MNTLEAMQSTRALMNKYGFTSWSFNFNNRFSSLGLCIYATREIQLSRPYVNANTWEVVRKTVLHEIAHALIPLENASHGPQWAETFIRIQKAEGISNPTAELTYHMEEFVRPPSPYVLVCPACNYQHPAYKPPRRAYSCGKCAPNRFDRKFLLELRAR
jgi:predicted SprT family Zn-dependent metalloprotease